METDAVKTRHHRINLNYHESNPRNAKLSFSIAISPYLQFFFFFCPGRSLRIELPYFFNGHYARCWKARHDFFHQGAFRLVREEDLNKICAMLCLVKICMWLNTVHYVEGQESRRSSIQKPTFFRTPRKASSEKMVFKLTPEQ